MDILAMIIWQGIYEATTLIFSFRQALQRLDGLVAGNTSGSFSF